MNWIALKMLVGDDRKYVAIVLGVAFATLLVAHQSSVFWCVMRRTIGRISDIHPQGIWVMDPSCQYVDEIRPIPSEAVDQVRGVRGVSWAAPLSTSVVRANVQDGGYRQVVLLGVDDATLAGAPRTMLLGERLSLQNPESVIIDKAGYTYLWPGQPLRLGNVLEIHEQRTVVAGICEASPPFQTLPILYTRISEARRLAPHERYAVSFVLAECDGRRSALSVCAQIEADTELKAMTADEFSWQTIGYYFRCTGIPLNFGVTVSIGFLVGIAVAGQTFYLFTLENLQYFSVLKSMGAANATLVRMVMVQACIVGAIGYGVGIGLATLLLELLTHNIPHLAGFYLPWQVTLTTAAAVLTIIILSSVCSIRRVLVLEPSTVFRG